MKTTTLQRSALMTAACALAIGCTPSESPRGEQCDMTTPGGPLCGPGTAEGPPTVTAWAEKWHGSGVVSAAGAVVDNGMHSAGVAGQTMVPMLYKYDLGTYAFDIGDVRDALAPVAWRRFARGW